MAILIIIIGIIVFINCFNKKEKGKRIKFKIPKEAWIIKYYEGYTLPLNNKIYFWHSNDELYLCDPKISDEHIIINIKDILNFNMVGQFYQTTETKGGGVSLGGAVAGGVLLGGVGAIVGGRKKVKSNTKTTDTRKIILKFKEDDIEKGMVLDVRINDVLCFMCPTKKIA